MPRLEREEAPAIGEKLIQKGRDPKHQQLLKQEIGRLQGLWASGEVHFVNKRQLGTVAAANVGVMVQQAKQPENPSSTQPKEKIKRAKQKTPQRTIRFDETIIRILGEKPEGYKRPSHQDIAMKASQELGIPIPKSRVNRRLIALRKAGRIPTRKS